MQNYIILKVDGDGKESGFGTIRITPFSNDKYFHFLHIPVLFQLAPLKD